MARLTGAEAVRAAVAPAVDGAGLYLEDVQVTRAGSRSVVRIVVDLPEDEIGGVDSDAVAAVSREISGALDQADAVAGAYTLEVSTPGTSRQLVTARHFKRARTHLVTLTLRDGTSVSGRLLAVDDELHLDDGSDQPRAVPLTEVAFGRIEVELRRAHVDDSDVDDSDAGPSDAGADDEEA